MRLRQRSKPAPGRALLLLSGASAACVFASPAGAQDAGTGNRNFVMAPTFSVEETYLETRGRITGSNGRESITRISPGLRLSSRSGRVQGALDYAGNLLYRAGREESAGADFQNSLNAAFVVEAVSNWLFVDARASISQQAISAFGQQSVEGSQQSNANRSEVSTLSLSPYARGNLGSWASYEVRLNASGTSSGTAEASDSRSSGGSVLVQSARGGSMLGWALSASQQRVEYTGFSTSEIDTGRVNATVSLTPDPSLRLSASAGRESVDQSRGAEHRSDTTSGVGLQWSPSPRTSLLIDVAERYFGRSARVGFSHRLSRTILSYSYTRDLNQGADAFNLGQPKTMFQLFFEQAASAFPDPAEREAAVLARLNGLGLDPNQLVATSFLSSTLSVQQRQDVAFVWLGLRTTLNVQAYTNAQSQLISIVGSDPTIGEAVRVHGYSSSVSYRLTPQTSITAGGSRQMTFGTGVRAGNDLKSANLSLTSQVGARTTAQLGSRYTVFNSTTDPYRETSVSASLSLRF